MCVCVFYLISSEALVAWTQSEGGWAYAIYSYVFMLVWWYLLFCTHTLTHTHTHTHNWHIICVQILIPTQTRPSLLVRVFDPVLRRQHVHEGGDAGGHAHRGRGRLPAFHVPACIWPAHGRHLPRVGWHAEARAGQREGEADFQPRYRINRPRRLDLTSYSRGRPDCFCAFILFYLRSRLDIRPNTY